MAGCSRVPTRSPANGGTTRFRLRRPRISRCPRATAGSGAASRPIIRDMPRGNPMKRIFVAATLLATALFAHAVTEVKVPAGHAVATFAGGCFWCMEGPFDRLPGVDATISGYMGGHTANPTYEQVSS